MVTAGCWLIRGKITPVADPLRRRVTLSITRYSPRCPSGHGWRVAAAPAGPVKDLEDGRAEHRAVRTPAAPTGFAHGPMDGFVDEAEGRVEPVLDTGTGETR